MPFVQGWLFSLVALSLLVPAGVRAQAPQGGHPADGPAAQATQLLQLAVIE